MALRADPQALLRNATILTQQGWPVFLLGRTKRPLANCADCPKDAPNHDRETCPCLTCHGFYAATLDPDRLHTMCHQHSRGLLAIRTGATSGTVVIDIDPRHGGHLIPDLMPRTACVATGANGWHLYYRHPGTPILSRPLPGHVGIDVKADGGYVVAPPSIHPRTGRPYRWVDAHPLVEMAAALLDLCQAAPALTVTRTTTSTPPRGARAISAPDALLASILAAVARAPKGRHRVTLYGAARGVARMVAANAITHTDAITALTHAGRDAHQTEREIREAITGGFKAEGIAA